MPRAAAGEADKQGGDQGDTSLFAPELKGLRKSANRDAIFKDNRFKTGRYILLPAGAKEDANRDAFLVEIDLISNG
jgi:hypothetical protein